jgi:hypothetical protein
MSSERKHVGDRIKKLHKPAPMLRSAVHPLLTGKVEDWHGEYAYSLGLQAFVYGFPYIYNAQIRHKWVTEAKDPKFTPYAAVNEFWHASQLMDASYRDGGCPNNDTLYSIAWLDLGPEPIVLSHPDMGSGTSPSSSSGSIRTTSTTSDNGPPGPSRATSRSSVPTHG